MKLKHEMSICQLAKIGQSRLSNKILQQLIWQHHVLVPHFNFLCSEDFHNKSETFSNWVKWKVSNRFELYVQILFCSKLFSTSSLLWHDWTTWLTFNKTIHNSLQSNTFQLPQLKLIINFCKISDIFFR